MTPRKPPKKTPRQLAEESWLEIEPILLEDMRMKIRLYQMGYIKGYYKAKEDESRVRIKPSKK